MENELSLTDIYFIQPLLTKSSYEEIAELISKPVDLVADYANRFAQKNGIVSKQSIIDQKTEKRTRQRRKKRNGARLSQTAERNKKMTTGPEKRRSENEREKTASSNLQRSRKVEKVFETRHEDLSKKISVRLDHKTTVFVDPGTDIEEFRKKYEERMNRSKEILKPKKAYTEVKKFKPLK